MGGVQRHFQLFGSEKIGPKTKNQKTTSTESNPCQHLMKMRRTPEGVAKSSRKESGLQPLRWPPTTLMALGPQPSATPCLQWRPSTTGVPRLHPPKSPLQ